MRSSAAYLRLTVRRAVAVRTSRHILRSLHPPAAPLRRLLVCAALSAGLGWISLAGAAEAPHNVACSECHQIHTIFGKQYESTAGNENVCQSCHQPGGSARATAMLDSSQASPWNGLPGQGPARGTSHRWDSSAAGRVVALGAAPPDAIIPTGVFTGRYERAYTITITTGGSVGVARFNWTGSAPGGGGGTNVLTGGNVTLDQGAAVRFINYKPAPAFQVGDSWQLLVRPDLHDPSDPAIQWVTTGQTICSACHDQHSQQAEPFDPKAPAYPNGPRHFMRIDNDADQLCMECHSPRFVTNAAAGSHPVGVLVSSNAALHPPATLPLDKNEGKMWCSTCHQPHNSPGDDGRLLRAKNESALCAECHALVDTTTPATHLNPLTGPLWPGGQYGSVLPADADPAHRGACGNCHRVHGWPDSAAPTNDYPSLLVENGENLCFTCHDGNPSAKNLRGVYTKTYKHPVSLSGRHSPDEAGNPTAYGTTNRHSECADCHNTHRTTPDIIAPVAPQAAGALQGAARVSVENISPDQMNFTFRGASDPTPAREYEVCFTCHSSWTTQPAGQADYAAKFNTQNASFHPVEGPGRNLNINPNAFVNGWDATKTMYCTDCHTSDDPTIRGPHASSNRYILKKPATASSAKRTMTSNEHCFDCHRFDTYANKDSAEAVRGYSRFNKPQEGKGHTFHVHEKQYPCYACHETHGSSDQPHLIVTGRNPGITTYTRTDTGGTCVVTCHGSKNYKINYSR